MNVRSSVPLRTQATVRRYKIVIAGIPPVRELDVIGPLEVFNTANKALENSGSGYDLELLTTHDTRTLPGMTGISISAHRCYCDFAGPLDTLLVAGGTGAETTKNPAFSEWLRQITVSARRIASICSGAFLLAEAGLLDGKRATTHWKLASELATHYPRVQVDPNPIWIQQGNVYTSAGITAGMDLALALVEEDFGSQIALEVARHLVIFLRRPGGQAQYSVALSLQGSEQKTLQELVVWIVDNLRRRLSVDELAHRAAMSPRNFARVFRRKTGKTPARFVEELRVEAARRLLEETNRGIDEIAAACGFGNGQLMRRAFLRSMEITPGDYRQRFQRASPAPGDQTGAPSRFV